MKACPRSWTPVLNLLLIAALVMPPHSLPSAFAAENEFPGTIDFPGEDENPTNPTNPTDTTPPPRGADGVEFQVLPIDTGVDCSSVVLKGTRRFQGTAFVLPRIVVSINKQQEELFEILQLSRGRYLLRFAVYFPRTHEDLEMRANNRNFYFHGCNLDDVRQSMNKGVKDEKQQIKQLAPLPISTIEVKIDGVNKGYKLGGGQSTLLNYQGTDHVVEYQFNTREELDEVLARIQGEIGLGIHVNMKFNARSADGALFAEVDMRQLAASVGAALKGSQTVTSEELSGVISNAVRKMSLNIQTEEGSTDVYKNITTQIMGLIANAAETDMNLRRKYEQNDDFWRPEPDPTDPGTNPTDPTPPTPPTIEPPIRYGVAAVVSFLRKKTKITVNYTNVGKAQEQVYTTSVIFKGAIEDPDVRLLNIRSNEDRGRRVATQILKGQSFTIAAVEAAKERIDYVTTKRYYTARELRANKLHDVFPLLGNETMKIEDKTMKDGLVGVMKEKQGWSGAFKKDFYVWGKVETEPAYKTVQDVRLEGNEDTIGILPIAVGFSKVGTNRFRLRDLLTENAAWKGMFDALGGRLVVTAKRDLGNMTVWNLDKAQNQEVVTSYYFQELRTPQKVVRTDRRNETKQVLPVERSTVRLNVSLNVADATGGQQQIQIPTQVPSQMNNGHNSANVIGVVKPQRKTSKNKDIIVP